MSARSIPHPRMGPPPSQRSRAPAKAKGAPEPECAVLLASERFLLATAQRTAWKPGDGRLTAIINEQEAALEQLQKAVRIKRRRGR